MKATIKNIFVITFPTLIILFLILELFFRYVIPASEAPMVFFDEKELLSRFDSSENEGIYTIGKFAQQKGKWKINNFGWNSSVDYCPKKAKKRIAIFGDSYIEDFRTDIDKSYPSLLRNEIGNVYDVYSFGASGAPLSEYLNYSRYANYYFNPDILIFNVVHNDFDESVFQLCSKKHFLQLNITDTSITEITPIPNYSLSQFRWSKRILRKSALFRYLYYNLEVRHFINNLKIQSKDTVEYNANVDVFTVKKSIEIINFAVDYIIGKMREENPHKRIIFIIDAPRHDIYNYNLKNSNVLFLHDILIKYCLKSNAEFIDLSESMYEDYKKNHIKFNSEIDNHWDEYGHRFVYGQLLNYLKKTDSIEE